MQIQTQQYNIRKQHNPAFGFVLKKVNNIEAISIDERTSVLNKIIGSLTADIKDIGKGETANTQVQLDITEFKRSNGVSFTLQATDKGMTQYVITRPIETEGIPPKECPLELFKTALIKFATELADNIDNKRPQKYGSAGTQLA